MKDFMIKSFFLLFTMATMAQTKIVNSEGTAIEYVNIGIVGTHKGLISDENGVFSLQKLAPNSTDSIYFSHISYKKAIFLAKDIQDKIVLEKADIQLPEATIKIKTPKIQTLKSKGIPTIVTIESNFQTDGDESDGIVTEIGDFITLSKDAMLTEFELSVAKNTYKKAIFRVELYQSNKEHTVFTPLTEKPIYVEVPYSQEKQHIQQKIAVFAPKGVLWIGVRWVDAEGEKDAKLTFRATGGFGWIRTDDGKTNEVERIPLALSIPFSLKGALINND
jgi:hypothetical protein